VEVVDDLAGIEIGVLADRLGHTDPGLRMQGRQPLAVHVHAVLDRLVLLQREGESKANHVHAPFYLEWSVNFNTDVFGLSIMI